MVKQLTKVAVVGLIGLGLMLSAQPAMAQTIAYIRNDGAGDYATHDGNIIAALGAAGITVDGTAIPGLGYTIVEYQHGAEPDPGTWPAPAPDLIFISQTVGSGNVKNHTTETIPIVNTEAALHDDGGTPCDMYFSDGQGGRTGETEFVITDNSHPITAIFPVGIPLTMFRAGQNGVMTGDLAAGVTSLAVNGDDASEDSLAIADVGATPFRSGIAAGADPAPARRVCLGFHSGSMEDPTVAGIYLLQRTVQWAIGDPVAAGVPVGGGVVTRDLGGSGSTPAEYVPGGAWSYDLVLTAGGSDSFQTTDTVPAAFTITGVTAPAGDTASFSGQVVSWSGSFATDGEYRCTVDVTCPASGSYMWPTDSPFTAGAGPNGVITSYVKYGARWDDAPEGYWANEPGVAPTLASTGVPFIEQDFENTTQPGATSYIDKGGAGFSPEDVWIMRGAGNQFWSSGDDYHMTYVLVEGDFDIRARWQMHPPPPFQETRVGMIARNIDLFNNNPALHGGVIWNKDNYGPAQIRRPNDGAGIGRSDRPNNLIRPNGDIYMRLVRQGTETRLYWNPFPTTGTTLSEPTGSYVTDVALNNVVALGLGGSAGEEDGEPQGYFEAEYTSVSAPVITLYDPPIAGANRGLSATTALPGDTINVTLNLPYAADATTVTVVENVPAGHGPFVTNVSNGGVVSGDSITWTFAPYTNASPASVTYDVVLKWQGSYLPYWFSGAYWEDLDGYGEMIADSSVSQQGVLAAFQEGVLPDASYDGAADNHIIVNTPLSNQGAWDHTEEGDWRGTTDGNGLDDHKKILVKFDMSSVSPGPAFTKAVVGLYFDAQRRGGISLEPHTLTAYPVLKQWVEGTGDGSDGPDALAGESNWLSAQSGVLDWETSGAMGVTDVGPLESSTFWDAQLNQWVNIEVTTSTAAMIATATADDDQGWKVSQDVVRGVTDTYPGNTGLGNEYVRGAYDAASAQNGNPFIRPYLALLDGTEFDPTALTIGTATRTFGAAGYTWGQPLTVTITVTNTAPSQSLRIVEPIPDGMTAAEIGNISAGGAIVGNEIVWTLTPFNADAVVTYEVTVPQAYIDAAFLPLRFGEGSAEDAAGLGIPVAANAIGHAGVYTFQDGIYPDASYDGCQDAYIIVFQSNNNAGGNDFVEEGDWDGTAAGTGLGDHKKVLIQFDLSSIPTTDVIVDARLLLYADNERRGGIVKQDHFLTPWTILKAWNEGDGTGNDGRTAVADEVSWNNANVGADTGTTVPWEIAGAMGVTDVGTSEPSTFFDLVNDTSAVVPQWLSFDVTDSVANMVANPADNHGWKVCQDKLIGVPDNTPGNEYVQGAYQFVASEAGGAEATLRPMLVVRTDQATPVDVRRFILW